MSSPETDKKRITMMQHRYPEYKQIGMQFSHISEIRLFVCIVKLS